MYTTDKLSLLLLLQLLLLLLCVLPPVDPFKGLTTVYLHTFNVSGYSKSKRLKRRFSILCVRYFD